MKLRKIRYEVGETILITLTFIIIVPKFIKSHPVEELRDETVRQRHAIFEPQSPAEYIDELDFDSSTSLSKREAVITTKKVTTTKAPVTVFTVTEMETPPTITTALPPKKRGKIIAEVKF